MTSSTETTATTPQVAVNDIGNEEAFLAAIDETIKYFNDGDIVDGVIVKVDRDEVLLDIGYKTEGVIPSRELSIKHDVDPNEVVAVGDEIEALVLQKEDKEGRLILSKSAPSTSAPGAPSRRSRKRTASSPVPSSRSSRVVSSSTSASVASSRPPWSRCAASATSSPTWARSSRRRSSSWTRTATTWSCPAVPGC
ncbi:hypothetical protein SHIRM173S_05768 [Streptomyces hirsutus]